MSVVKQIVGTRTAVTVSGLSTLASATYAVSAAVNNTTNAPLDLLVELAVTPGTVSGYKQALLFAQGSLDGTNWQSGPTSGTDETNESNLTLIGMLPLAQNATPQAHIFSVAGKYDGPLPPYIRFVIKNDSGAAFTAGSLYCSEVTSTVT